MGPFVQVFCGDRSFVLYIVISSGFKLRVGFCLLFTSPALPASSTYTGQNAHARKHHYHAHWCFVFVYIARSARFENVHKTECSCKKAPLSYSLVLRVRLHRPPCPLRVRTEDRMLMQENTIIILTGASSSFLRFGNTRTHRSDTR